MEMVVSSKGEGPFERGDRPSDDDDDVGSRFGFHPSKAKLTVSSRRSFAFVIRPCCLSGTNNTRHDDALGAQWMRMQWQKTKEREHKIYIKKKKNLSVHLCTVGVFAYKPKPEALKHKKMVVLRERKEKNAEI
ncbi:hypothetical protein OUZ56_004780 [Daphnia magna]|uniref:Uncharacterized protein n=1 Tax=Daphnia magna TaxID=35525 RepID=A0ABQ9YQU6_9CRUS|nr:hypothetical protein OUZ56_004780 [Daphnia magna]